MKKIGELFKKALADMDWSLGLAAMLSVFCLMFVYSIASLLDSDIWLHLKTGEFIFKNKFIPINDIFSFTFSGKPWIDHEWVFQLLTYFSYSHWGASGLIYLEMFGLISAFLILAFACRRLTGAYFETAVLTFITFSGCISRFNIRPDIFSFLFFCCYLYLLEFCLHKKKLWFILPLQIVWVNLHGYFSLGLFVIAIYLLAEFLRRKIKFLPEAYKSAGALDNRAYRRLKIILLLAVLASLVNPQGYLGAIYPLQVISGIFAHQAKEAFGYIQELRPVFKLQFGSFKFYYLLGLLYFLVLVSNIKKLRVRDLLLASFFFLFGIIARNIFFSAAVAFMGIAYYWGEFLVKVNVNFAQNSKFTMARYKFTRCILALIFLNFIGAEVFAHLNSSRFNFVSQKIYSPFMDWERERYPEKAVDFILENKLPARLFNDFNSGAYLIGRAYPLRQVFIDGRSEFYGTEFFSQYLKAEKGDVSSIEAVVKKYDLQGALFSLVNRKPQPVIGYFYKNSNWKLVFFDDKAVVFLKNVPANRQLIKKYGVNLRKYKVSPVDLRKVGVSNIYPTPYLSRSNLFEMFGLDNLVIAEAKEALRISPDCWQAQFLLGRAYLRQKLYAQAWEALRQAAIFSPQNQEIFDELAQVARAEKKKK